MTHFHKHVPHSKGPEDPSIPSKDEKKQALKRIGPVLAKNNVTPDHLKKLWRELLKDYSPRFSDIHALGDQIFHHLSSGKTHDQDKEPEGEEDSTPPPVSDNFDWRKVIIHLSRKDRMPDSGIMRVFMRLLDKSDFNLGNALNIHEIQSLRDYLRHL